ncbi:MAG: GtrA family protein [Deltaproteobacteria bacterium]
MSSKATPTEGIPTKSVKFLLTGGINTVIFYMVYVLLIQLGCHYAVALPVEYTGGIIAGYCMNRFWTFSSHGSTVHSPLKYLATYVFVFCLNLLFLSLIVELRILGPIVAQVVVIGIVSVISFLLQNFWVFHSADNRVSQRSA